jgi:uncharacterized protein (DUF849 family)
MTDKLLIMAAPAGTETTDWSREAEACAGAGAGMMRLELPVSAENGLPEAAAAVEALAAAAEGAQERLLPVLPAMATSLGPDAVQAFIREVKPQAVILDVRRLMPDEGDEALKRARGFFRWLKVMDILPLFAMRRAEDVAFFVRMRAMDYIPFRQPFLLFELGSPGAADQDTAAALDAFTGALDGQPVVWAVCTHGQDEAAVIFKAVLGGGHVCTGTAFNRQLPDGGEAADTAALVQAASGIIAQTGREIMGADDVRQLIRACLR